MVVLGMVSWTADAMPVLAADCLSWALERAPAESGVPQSSQKALPGGLIEPQAEHVIANGLPQLRQNRLPGVTACPQVGHSAVRSSMVPLSYHAEVA